MKLYPACVLVLVISGLAMTKGRAGEPYLIYPGLQGKPYARVRHALLNAGMTPAPPSEPPDCPYDATFCHYPELHSCFVDVPSCVLLWKAKNGRLIHIEADMTSGGTDPRVTLSEENSEYRFRREFDECGMSHGTAHPTMLAFQAGGSSKKTNESAGHRPSRWS